MKWKLLSRALDFGLTVGIVEFKGLSPYDLFQAWGFIYWLLIGVKGNTTPIYVVFPYSLLSPSILSDV